MVSLSVVKDSSYFTRVNHSSGHGVEYFSQRGLSESWWQGKLAEKEGLNSVVTEQDISRLTQGYERVGLNITYSAPKSVSLAYSLLGDERVKQAHEQAVRTANEWLEKHLAQTRQGQGGEERVQASAVAIANFTHNVSRENDPQLHTHSVVLNVVERSTDGKLTALEPQKIFEYQKALDQVYKNELARALQELGYSVHMTDQHGNFEITGFPQQVLDAFSTRKEQVLETAERLKSEGKIVTENEYTLRDIAALESRAEKQFLSAEQLQAKWDEKLRGIGMTREELKQMVTQQLTHVSETLKQPPEKEHDRATEYVKAATAIIHENESAFTIEKLTEISLRLSMSDAAKGEKVLSEKDISAAIQGLSQQGWIKEVEQGYFTTVDMQRIEKEILGMALSGIGRAEKIASKEEIDKAIEKFQAEKGISMTNDQKQAVHHILSSQDRVIGIQGDAGTGKTTSLEVVKDYLQSQGYTIRGMAPTGKAADELAKVGIKSQTVDAFLTRYQMHVVETEDIRRYHELNQKFNFSGKGIPFLKNETGESWLRGEIAKQFGYSRDWGVKQYEFGDGAKMVVEWNKAGMNVYTKHASGNITVKTFAKADAINSMVQVGEKKYIAPDRAVERGREVWIVDESSMLSSQKMHELLQRAREADARVIFIGDIKQLPGVGAGKMFQELQERGMSTYRMKENIRQVDEEYRQLVRDLADRKFEQVLQKLEIREIPKSESDDKDKNDKAKYDAIVRDFMRAPATTIVVATTNKEVAEINGRIQAELSKWQKKSSQQESLEDKEPEGVTFAARISKNLTPEEKRYSFSYAPGDIVFISKKDMKQMDIPGKSNEFYIKHVDHRNNTIRIARMGAKDTYEVDLKKWGEKLTVYHEPHNLTVGVGDRLISGKNDRELKVKNGQMWWVSAIDPERGTFTVTNKRGVTKEIDPNRYNYFSRGYCVTTYKSQGTTINRVIVVAGKDTNYQKLYTAITRGKEQFTIYAHNREEVIRKMQEEHQKTSSLPSAGKVVQAQEKSSSQEKAQGQEKTLQSPGETTRGAEQAQASMGR